MADYSNIEFRMLAYYVAITPGIEDTSIADDFRAGRDMHDESAKRMFGDDFTDTQRQAAKVLNFSIVYGGGCPTLINQGIAKDFPEAKRILRAYHEARPGIVKLQEKVIAQYRKKGYIKNFWGRHLHPPGEHQLVNALLQGGAADLIKQAMRKTNRWHAEHPELESHLVNVVHDELMFDTPMDEIELLLEQVPILMDDPRISAVVPVTVECEYTTTSWADKQSFAEENVIAA